MPSEPGDYIRKVGEHFISFIHKLDQAGVTAKMENSLYGGNATDYWLNVVGTHMLQVLSQKYMRINMLSSEGEKQLIADIVYIRKLIGQFLNSPSQ